MTNRDIVSKVKTLLRFNNSDVFITDRTILSVVQDVNIKLVTQQLQKRSYWNSPNLFTTIECLDMEEVPLYECCDTTSDCTIARSKLKLPEIVDCMFGLVIRGVWSIDGKVEFKELSSPNRLTNLIKIYPNKPFPKRYYFIHNNYLYITDPDILKVKISAFFKEVLNPNEFDCSATDSCPINPLDGKFATLPKLVDDITRISADLLMQTVVQIPQEQTSDDKERN